MYTSTYTNMGEEFIGSGGPTIMSPISMGCLNVFGKIKMTKIRWCFYKAVFDV